MIKGSTLPPMGPANTALIVHDMENDFLRDAISTKPEMRAVVTRVRKLIDLAHSLRMPVIYTRFESDPAFGHPPEREPFLRWRGRDVCVKGTAGAEIVDELKPAPEDYVVTKVRYSAFYATYLETLLRIKGVWILIVAGGSTNWGVEWLARDAWCRDIATVVLRDCTYSATLEAQNASLANIDDFIGHVANWDQVMATLAGFKNDPALPQRPGNSRKMAIERRTYTPLQGRYLAFIHYYTRVHGRSPAETDMQMHFNVSPPSVHQMVLTLEKRGLITRTPGEARSIRLLLPREELPDLQ